jgi:hypothetical protein
MKEMLELEKSVDRLMDVLDRDIENLQKNLSRLDQMRSAVIKRDDVSMGRLLDEIRSESQMLQMQQSQRKLARKELAENLGCNCEDVTLTRLEEILPEGRGMILAEKKEQLRTLTTKLKREYSATAILLAECARFNRLLLKTIFGGQRAEVITYDALGSAKRQSEAAFVNLKL